MRESKSETTTTLADEIATGDSIRLNDIARRFQVNPSTAHRWAFRGLISPNGNRVKLEVIRFGKSWRTSEAALRRFLVALPHGATITAQESIRSPLKRDRDSARAEAALKAKYGI